MNYPKSKADRIYDRILRKKVHMEKGMDCYVELREALSSSKYAQLVRTDGHHKSLDEWARTFRTSPSRLVRYLANATLKKDRAEAIEELEQQERQHFEEVSMSDNSISIELEVEPTKIVRKIPTRLLLEALNRRTKNGNVYDSEVSQGPADFGDPRDELEGNDPPADGGDGQK